MDSGQEKEGWDPAKHDKREKQLSLTITQCLQINSYFIYCSECLSLTLQSFIISNKKPTLKEVMALNVYAMSADINSLKHKSIKLTFHACLFSRKVHPHIQIVSHDEI